MWSLLDYLWCAAWFVSSNLVVCILLLWLQADVTCINAVPCELTRDERTYWMLLFEMLHSRNGRSGQTMTLCLRILLMMTLMLRAYWQGSVNKRPEMFRKRTSMAVEMVRDEMIPLPLCHNMPLYWSRRPYTCKVTRRVEQFFFLRKVVASCSFMWNSRSSDKVNLNRLLTSKIKFTHKHKVPKRTKNCTSTSLLSRKLFRPQLFRWIQVLANNQEKKN